MTIDDLVYLLGLKQIQIEMLTKQVKQFEFDKQVAQAVHQEPQKESHA